NDQFGPKESQKPYDRFQMNDLLKYKQQILEKENRRVKNDLIKNEVDVARGYGGLKDVHTVEVETHFGTVETYTADHILLCPGSRPTKPDAFKIDDNKILDSKSILKLTHIPRRLVIIGSGVNAFEYATTFSALGSRITLLCEEDDYMSFLDHEIRTHFEQSLDRKGITVKSGLTIEEVEFKPLRNDTEVKFRSTRDDDRLQVIETEHVLHLGGRRPHVEQLNLSAVDIEQDHGSFIVTDNNFETSTKGIFAAGDVIGFPKLASASFTQGRLAAQSMFGSSNQETSDKIPYGIYTIPGMANIGITEQQAREMGLDITVGRAYFKDNSKAHMTNNTEGLLKLVFETDSLKLRGVHIMGNEAGDLIHLGQSVMASGGNVRYFIQHVMNYPTL